jgi:hypothetical protein
MSSLIGLAGKARVGKGTFVTILSDLVRDNSHVREFAYATELKRELDPFLIAKYGISAFTTDNEQKKIIRPHLVERGAGARKEDPFHWIRIVAPQVELALAHGEIVVISDNRYANECDWVHSRGGKVVYIERILPDGSLQPAANEEEAKNDPEARAASDIILSWPTLPLDRLRPYVQDVWSQLNGVSIK